MTPQMQTKDAVLALLRMECFTSNASGELVNRGGFVPFVDSLAPHFKRIEVIAPIVPDLDVPADAPTFRASNVIFRPLPNLKGLVRCWRNGSQARKRLDNWSAHWDLVNLRAPDNFLPVAARYLREREIPHYVQLVSHPFEAEGAAIGNLRPALRPAGKLAWIRQHAAIKRVCKDRLCIAHGESLQEIAAGYGADAINLPSGSLSRADVRPVAREGKPRRLLFVGRIDPEKGLDVLLRALSSLTDMDLELTIVGWSTGDLRQRLEDLALVLGVAERVHFVGAMGHGPELFDLYQRSDAFVLPSISEGTPRVIGEAMAFGLPVVSTRAGGIPDLIQHKRTGLLTKPGDVQDLASALRTLVQDDTLRHALVRNAAASVDERTLEAKAEKHVSLLAPLLGQPNPTAALPNEARMGAAL
ncbi:MAG: glycosyltransferase involved in cell wall biosynthesis [Planctomycetota bacterium]|jgi:glycosyltransferase involved in cell wall biosynthesis